MKNSVVIPPSSPSTSTAPESQCCKWGIEGIGVSDLSQEGPFPHPVAGSLQSWELTHHFQHHFVLRAVPGSASLHTDLLYLQLSPGGHRAPGFGVAQVYSPQYLPSSSWV